MGRANNSDFEFLSVTFDCSGTPLEMDWKVF